MNILLTGCAGFIGFHVTKTLLERGDRVIGIDNFNDSYDTNVKEDRNKILQTYPNYSLHRIDLCDQEKMRDIFQKEQINKICHLAARAGVLPSLKNPYPYEKTNILGTTTILQLAAEFGIKDIVIASSSSVYGANTKFPSSEDDRVDFPISLYAATKKAAEIISYYYHQMFKLNITLLRFFNVYGEFGRPDMMPWIFTENILLGKAINVNNHGDTWKDYTYITDITRGVVASIDKPFSFEIINLGNHTPVHLKQCIEIIEQEVEKKAIINWKPMQEGDVVKSFADVSKAKRLFDWEPTTKMEVGLVNFIKWYRAYKKI